MAEKKKNRTIGKALLCGVLVSTSVCLIWFCASKNGRSIGLALVLLCMAAFPVWLISLLLLRKAGKARKVISLLLVTALNFCSYFSVCAYHLIPTQLFHPDFDEKAYNELLQNPSAREIVIESGNGKLYGWFLKMQQGKAPLIICFGGNADNSSEWIERFTRRSAKKIAENCNIAMIDYPGYGKSEGKPGDEAMRKFGISVYDTLVQRDDVDGGNIIICGFSIGTGVANYVASKRDVKGLVLMAPYADGLDLVNGFLPIFYGPLENLVSFRMPAVQFAADIAVEPLIFASPDDEMIDFDSAVRLSEGYVGCEFITCEGFEHNDFWDDDEVIEKASKYITEAINDA